MPESTNVRVDGCSNATARRFLRTMSCLENIVNDGVAATGAQLSVALKGRPVADVAVGATLGVPMQSKHLHPGYCVTKPLLGLAVGLIIDRHGLTLDEPSERRWAADETPISLAALLNHSAGLARPSTLEWRATRRPERADARSVKASRRPAYSEVAAGLLIERFIESTTELPAGVFIEREILVPLGIQHGIVVSPASARQPAVRRRTSGTRGRASEGAGLHAVGTSASR